MYTHTHTHTQDSHELLRLRSELRDAQNLTDEWRVESGRQQSAYAQAEKERLEAQAQNAQKSASGGVIHKAHLSTDFRECLQARAEKCC